VQTLEELNSGELKNSKSLKLSCGLKEVPMEVFSLADTLEILDLSGNQISELPDNFDYLHNLKILFLSENHFTKFPSILARCPNLDIIGFKANKISQIEENSFPPQLRWLILTNNDLPFLPKSIGKCHRLQKLMLAGNRLTSLPSELINCTNLELIRISANKINVFPEWLLSLPKLSWLAFAGNTDYSHQIKNKIREINWIDLIIKEKLGEGASGTIYLCELKESQSKDVALKLFKGDITSDGFPADEMNASIQAGNHYNLVKIIGKISNHPKDMQGLVLELIPKEYKNLGNPPNFESCTRDTFPENTYFTTEEILRILISISSALKHLQEKNILHGDLYAHNILFEKKSIHILFGDFGASTVYDSLPQFKNKLIQLEVRAFGCLMEDLLDRSCNNTKDYNAQLELNRLKEECIQTYVFNRPFFEEISDRLDKIQKEYF
jgi:Protein tyrosine and serine/threonine kinase/Leucine rich repeat